MREWHAFGVISEGPQSGMHYMLITSLGDFTELIADPPSQVYTRIFKFVGLPYTVQLYSKCLGVATGSGLGISFSLLLQGDSLHLLWIASDVQAVYGSKVLDLLDRVDQRRITIYDPKIQGRTDLGKLAVASARNMQAEAVFVTSNRAGTNLIVDACRVAGIAAFGPIFDS